MVKQAHPARLRLSWTLAAATMLVGLTTILAGSALIRLASPDIANPFVMPLSIAADSAAEAALDGDPTRGDLADAGRYNDTSLSLSPMSPQAWLTKAYIAQQEAGGLTPNVLDALRRSYDVAPYGPNVSVWRIRFAFAHWTRLPPDLRALVIRELAVVREVRSGQLAQAVGTIEDPAGRRALILALDPATLSLLQRSALMQGQGRDSDVTQAR